MKAFRSSLQFLRKTTVSDQPPYFNFMDRTNFPFLSTVWQQQSKIFTNPLTLEGMCDIKTVPGFLEKAKSKEELNLTGVQRKEFLIVGRSNVGKSSLINSLTAQNAASISNYPGKTRHLFFFKIGVSGLVLVDAPGYGYAKGDQKELLSWGKMIMKYMDQSKNLYRVVILIDAEHGFKETDFMLMDLLEGKNKPFMVCLTKCDKIPNKPIDKLFEESVDKIRQYKMCSPIINATSAKTSYGIQELRANLIYLLNTQSI